MLLGSRPELCSELSSISLAKNKSFNIFQRVWRHLLQNHLKYLQFPLLRGRVPMLGVTNVLSLASSVLFVSIWGHSINLLSDLVVSRL